MDFIAFVDMEEGMASSVGLDLVEELAIREREEFMIAFIGRIKKGIEDNLALVEE
jgi:hypothetical protein